MNTNAVDRKLLGIAGSLTTEQNVGVDVDGQRESDLAEPDSLACFLRGLRNALLLGVGIWGLIGLAVVRLVA
jgi:hypothetical protein